MMELCPVEAGREAWIRVELIEPFGTLIQTVKARFVPFVGMGSF